MYPVKAIGKKALGEGFQQFEIERNVGGDFDVTIDVKFCGICHSDVNFANNPGANFPLVPGHEIAGVVSGLGSKVNDLNIGDSVGVGCISDSCLSCGNCDQLDEHECEKGFNFTCNSKILHGHIKTSQGWTLGGFSKTTTINRRFVVRIPKDYPLPQAGPIMCSGITTYSPLIRWGAGKGGKRVGVVGLGGLGQMGVALASALGNTVTAISTSPDKEQSARKLGATKFIPWTSSEDMEQNKNSLDIIINTVSASHSLESLLPLLAPHGVLVQLGIVGEPHQIHQNLLISRRLVIAGSTIGGMRETQEVMNFCAEKNIQPNVEIIGASQLDEVFEELKGKNKAMTRYVLDVNTI